MGEGEGEGEKRRRDKRTKRSGKGKADSPSSLDKCKCKSWAESHGLRRQISSCKGEQSRSPHRPRRARAGTSWRECPGPQTPLNCPLRRQSCGPQSTAGSSCAESPDQTCDTRPRQTRAPNRPPPLAGEASPKRPLPHSQRRPPSRRGARAHPRPPPRRPAAPPSSRAAPPARPPARPLGEAPQIQLSTFAPQKPTLALLRH